MKQIKYVTRFWGFILLIALLAACSTTPTPTALDETLETQASTAYTLYY